MPFDTSPILGYDAQKIEISNSEMQTYKRCKRRWWLEYYRGLKPKEKEHTGALQLGIRVHNALEQFYANDADLLETYDALYAIDLVKFEASKQYQDEKKQKKFLSEGDLGRIMLEGYLEWLTETNIDSTMRVVSAETKLSYQLSDRVDLIGKIDLKIERASDGSRAIFDHKTAMTFNDYMLHSHMSEQLMLYTMLEKLDPSQTSAVDGGTYNLLKKVKRTAAAKPPFYDRIDIRFNKQTLNSYWLRVNGVVNDMIATRDALDKGADHRYVAYPTPKMDWSCAMCPFFQVCSLLDDGSAAEAMLEDYYEHIDPNERYGTENNENEGN